jgi:PrtD family type I secretion system ABC transporter
MTGRESEIHRVLKASTKAFAAIAGLSLAMNLLVMASPLYMMQIFDRVLSSRSLDTLVMLTLIVSLAFAVQSLVDAIRSLMLSRIGAWLEERMGPGVLGAAVRTTLRGGGGAAAQGMGDLATLRGFLTGQSILPLMDLPWAVLFLLALFALHPLLGAVGLVGGFLLFGLALVNDVVVRRPLSRAGVAASRASHGSGAALRNAEVIRAMGMLEGVVRLWRREALAAGAEQIAAGQRGAAVLAVSKFFRLAVQTAIMAVGAYLVIEHDLSPGAMFASSFLLGRALAPVENAIATWRSLVAARLAYRRLDKLLAAMPQAPRAMALPPPQGALRLERVSYVPPGAAAPTLSGVSLALQPGEMLGVIGPSAAGKSTLARLIAGAWAPSAGEVRLDGGSIGLWLDSGGSQHLGYLPQDIELFAGSVRDNIARLGDADPDAIVEAAKLAGLHETVMRLPRGYDTDIGEGGAHLSGGQRQRVGLARALFGAPRLIVLDEPDAHLDHAGDAALHDAIASAKRRGATVIVVAHRAAVLSLADKLLVLRDGMIERFGPRTEVMAALAPVAVVPQRRTA